MCACGYRVATGRQRRQLHQPTLAACVIEVDNGDCGAGCLSFQTSRFEVCENYCILARCQKSQCCVVSNALLANEGHCIGPGAGIVIGAKESDVLDARLDRPRGRGMFLTGHFTLPPSGRALVVSCVVDVGIAAKQLTVVQYQDAANSIVYAIARSSI
jgi:hypothetical protein